LTTPTNGVLGGLKDGESHSTEVPAAKQLAEFIASTKLKEFLIDYIGDRRQALFSPSQVTKS